MIIKWQRVRKLYVASTDTHLHLVMFLMLFFFPSPPEVLPYTSPSFAKVDAHIKEIK